MQPSCEPALIYALSNVVPVVGVAHELIADDMSAPWVSGEGFQLCKFEFAA